MTDPEKIAYLQKALDEIRALTFDDCWEEHYYDFEYCRKEEARDWAKVQSTAANALRKTR